MNGTDVCIPSDEEGRYAHMKGTDVCIQTEAHINEAQANAHIDNIDEEWIRRGMVCRRRYARSISFVRQGREVRCTLVSCMKKIYVSIETRIYYYSCSALINYVQEIKIIQLIVIVFNVAQTKLIVIAQGIRFRAQATSYVPQSFCPYHAIRSVIRKWCTYVVRNLVIRHVRGHIFTSYNKSYGPVHNGQDCHSVVIRTYDFSYDKQKNCQT